MNARVIARRDSAGTWTLERDGRPIVDGCGLDDVDLVDRIEELVLIGYLDLADRIAVHERGQAVSLRGVADLLRSSGRRPWDVELASVLAERYTDVEHYY